MQSTDEHRTPVSSVRLCRTTGLQSSCLVGQFTPPYCCSPFLCNVANFCTTLALISVPFPRLHFLIIRLVPTCFLPIFLLPISFHVWPYYNPIAITCAFRIFFFYSSSSYYCVIFAEYAEDPCNECLTSRIHCRFQHNGSATTRLGGRILSTTFEFVDVLLAPQPMLTQPN